MPFPLVAAGMAAGGLSSIFGSMYGNRGQRSFRSGVQSRIDTQKDRLMQETPWEKMLAELYGGAEMNAGQDGLMQLLRTDPMTRTDLAQRTMEELAATGNPFDMSSLYAALDPLEDRDEAQQLAGFRSAGGGSLGKRFGSAYAGREADFRVNQGDRRAGRRASLAYQAHEGAQARRLTAAGGLASRETSNIQSFLDAMRTSQAGIGLKAGIAQAGGGMRQHREQSINQLLAALTGIQMPGGGQNPGEDVGGLMMLYGLMNKKGGGTSLPGSNFFDDIMKGIGM